ncbi:MAG TPA: hypothetical protein VFM93_00565 [Candidatus Limnocylindria bacterium]|nr:hypothetical protein [Candidatus Limnocylindria bacterium]
MKTRTWRKAFAIVGTGVLGAGILSGVALAAAPTTASGLAAVPSADGIVVTEEGRTDRAAFFARVLAGLVEKGVITKEQAEAILRAVAEAAAGQHLRARIALDLMRASVEYIGLPAEAVRGKLGAGKTLGEIADQQPGKSREGLIRFLHDKAQEAVNKAVAEGKLTEEQGRTLMQRLDTAIPQFVDKKWELPKREPRGEKQKNERGKTN